MNVEGEAYRYVHTSPGREALLTHDAAGWHLRLTEKGKEVARKDLPSRVEMVGAFNTLTPFVKHIWHKQTVVEEMANKHPKLLWHMRRHMSDEKINEFTERHGDNAYEKARKQAIVYAGLYHKQKEGAAA